MKRTQKQRHLLVTCATALAAVCCFLVAGTACASNASASDASDAASSAMELTANDVLVPGADRDPDTIKRYAGTTGVDTAIESSKAAFPEGSEYVVLARNDDYMDSMSATGLAGSYDAPVLLTSRTELSSQTFEEIKRLGAKTVFLIGGEVAVEPAVEESLRDAGVQVTRVFGTDACDTSVACASLIEQHDGKRNDLDTVIVATSIDFADALSVSSFAYKYHIPIFITTAEDASDGDRVLRSDAQSMIGAYEKVFVPGGPGALPTSSVEGIWGDKVTRIFGLTGYDTSVAVAKKMMDEGYLQGSSVGIATGTANAKGVDALTASSLLAKNDAPLVLVEDTVNTSAATAFIGDNNESFDKALVFGGTSVCPMSLMQEIDKSLRGVLHYVAVIGSDYWTSSKTSHHLQGSDLMILMRVDTEDATVSYLSVPRDTYYVQRGDDFRPSYPGQTCSDCSGKTWYKANYAFHYGYYQAKDAGASHEEATRAGAVKACEAMSEITKVGVTDYVVCDLMTFQKIVDTIGGLQIDLPYNIDYFFYDKSHEDVHLDAGEQTLDGFDSMVAARSRVSYRKEYGLDEDATRQMVDRKMLYSLMTAALDSDKIGLGNTGDLLNMLVSSGLVETNISSDDISEWSDALQQERDNLVVQSASGPTEVNRYELPELGYDGEGCIQTLVDYDGDAYASIAQEFCSGVRMNSAYSVETWRE